MNTFSKGKLAAWFAACRPKTLAAAAAPIALGTATGWSCAKSQLGNFAEIRLDFAIFALVFALLVQVTCNLANDLGDFLRGADTPQRRGPARMAATGALSPTELRRGTAVCAVAAFLVGLPLAAACGWWLVPVGALCLLAAFAYTNGPFPLAYNALGDVFVFLFFGFVAVLFTAFLQCGAFPFAAWVGGLVCGGLAVNILLVNNARDMETDAAAGKRTTVVCFGRRFANRLYTLNALLAVVVPTALLLWEAQCGGQAAGAGAHWKIALPLLCVPLAARLVWEFRRVSPTAPETYNPILGKSALFLLLHAMLVSVAFWG